MPCDGTHIYLTDTLESPHTTPPQLPLYLQPISEQHAKALKIKDQVPVIVCLGNPPYDRHEAADPKNLARTGGWVRYGDPLPAPMTAKRQAKTKGRLRDPQSLARYAMKQREQQSILYQAFLKPAIDAGHGVDVKNAYNLYVYFWRWALWKVFEHTTATGPGIVSFISASSYLDGDAFCGMREHLRRICDEIWIIDLGGEGRGTRKTDNVFAIQTPVAIAVAVCFGPTDRTKPAKVWYSQFDGSRDEKLGSLNRISALNSIQWKECPHDWHATFRPAGKGKYFGWPLLTDLFPWQHSGAQFKRTWPICPDRMALEERWQILLSATDRAPAFRETRDRKVSMQYPSLPKVGGSHSPIAKLSTTSAPPPIQQYAYRSFDRQWILADNRLGDFLRPDLWEAHSDRQLFVTTLLNHPLGDGPALTAAANIPDLHHFRGSYGAKEVLPLYRDDRCDQANVVPQLLTMLATAYKQTVTPEDFLAYVYGLLAHPFFTQRFSNELATRELRVPITSDAELFEKVRDVGAKLLWLHTYGQRYVSKGRRRGDVPKGKARCTKAVPGNEDDYPDKFEFDAATKCLLVGKGTFAPVESEVYNFEVSGLKVVQSWLGYRMKRPKGKKSSPLDDIRPTKWTREFTTELLELLWILEATIELYPIQAKLLSEVAKKRMIRI